MFGFDSCGKSLGNFPIAGQPKKAFSMPSLLTTGIASFGKKLSRQFQQKCREVQILCTVLLVQSQGVGMCIHDLWSRRRHRNSNRRGNGNCPVVRA